MKKAANKKKVLTKELLLILALCIPSCLYMRLVLESFPPAEDIPEFLLQLFLPLPMLLVAFYLQILIHEGGHLLFGLLTGYRFCSFRLFNFMLYHDGKKLRFGRYSLPGTSGQCLLEPPDLSPDGTMPYVLYNLGGVFLNAFTALLALIPALIWGGGTLWGIFCHFFVGLSLITVLSNVIPLVFNSLPNDGHNALTLGKRPELQQALWVQLKANACQTRGQRLQDLPEEWFALPDHDAMTHPLGAAIGDFRECLLLERRDFAGAEALIDQLLGDSTLALGPYKAMLQNDGIFLALLRGDKAKARAYVTPEQFTAMKQFKSLAFYRTRYAIELLLSGDEQTAKEIRWTFDKAAARWPYANDVAQEKAFMDMAEDMWKTYKAAK